MKFTPCHKFNISVSTASAAALAFLCLAPSGSLLASDVIIVQSAKIKAYEKTVRGFKDACNCQTQFVQLSEVDRGALSRLVESGRPKVIFAVGVDSLRAVSGINTAPIVYAMVLDPEKIVGSKRNVTGVRMHLPPEKQFSIMKRSFRKLKRVALLYDPLHNSSFATKARSAANAAGIELVPLPVANESEIPEMLENIDDVDALWLIPDNTIISPATLEVISLFSMECRVPVVAFSEQYLALGAALSIALDPYDVGRQAGEAAAKIVAGEDPPRIPAVEPRRSVVTLNPKVAGKCGVSTARDDQPEGRE